MIKSKVIDALKTLSQKELRELNDFIDSPFHNKNKNTRKLFRALKPFYPKFENKKLTKEFIYSSILPGNAYADKTFRNLMSDLLNLIEKYLSHSSFAQNPLFEKYLLISRMSKKGLFNLTDTTLNEADKIFEDSPFDGGNIFYFMHLIEMEKDFLSISKNKLINLNMKEGEYLVYAFLSKYLIFKMKFYNYRYKLGTEKLSEFIMEFEKSIGIERFISYLEKNPVPHREIILIYYYCTKFMSDLDNDAHYSKVRAMLAENKNILNRMETFNIYLTLNGFCIAKIKSGDKMYRKELFGLYKKMLEENLLPGVDETYMHITIFYNIATTALKIGESEWAKSFIDKWAGELMPEYRETMYNFMYSQYYFSKKEFEKALNHINNVNFENHYIKSGVRLLLLKIYYELKYTESFFSLSDTIKHYFANDKLIPEDTRKDDYKFVMLSNKLFKYILDPALYKPGDMKDEILKEISDSNKDWLLEKAEELETNIK